MGWLEFPHLYEMQRPKTGDDLRHIAGVFRPYLDARDWTTITRSTPLGRRGGAELSRSPDWHADAEGAAGQRLPT